MKPSKPPLYEEGGLFAAVGTGGHWPPARYIRSKNRRLSIRRRFVYSDFFLRGLGSGVCSTSIGSSASIRTSSPRLSRYASLAPS